MLLVADIGNSTIKLASIEAGRILSYQQIPTNSFRTSALLLPEKKHLFEVAICSVVPDIQSDFEVWLREEIPSIKTIYPLNRQTIQLKSLTTINCSAYQDNHLGTDRLMNLYGAFSINSDTNKLIIDLGTMCTIDLLSKDNDFLGGIIMPGPAALQRLLPSGIAAQLTSYQIDLLTAPKTVIGCSTETCLQSGFYYGHIGMLKEVISQLLRSVEWQPDITIILITGGGAKELATVLSSDYSCQHHPYLTLQGIEQFLKAELTNSN